MREPAPEGALQIAFQTKTNGAPMSCASWLEAAVEGQGTQVAPDRNPPAAAEGFHEVTTSRSGSQSGPCESRSHRDLTNSHGETAAGPVGSWEGPPTSGSGLLWLVTSRRVPYR